MKVEINMNRNPRGKINSSKIWTYLSYYMEGIAKTAPPDQSLVILVKTNKKKLLEGKRRYNLFNDTGVPNSYLMTGIIYCQTNF